MELASSDAAAILFFLYKEKEKNGGANRTDRVVGPNMVRRKIRRADGKTDKSDLENHCDLAEFVLVFWHFPHYNGMLELKI